LLPEPIVADVPRLVSGSQRCTLKLHPNDAQRASIGPHGLATVKSQVGQITLPVEITEDLMPGVVSIPHGWGHQQSGQKIASIQPGCNSNLLADNACLDGPSGNAVLSGIPVTIEAAIPERKMADSKTE
jgi:anaerobic selenocysteine-containing dehydrogenase